MRKSIVFVAMLVFVATASRGEYNLKISRGKYPEGVKVENINGAIPQSTWYKNGWTDQGWTAGDYGTFYNVALSPSGTPDEVGCENALTLPYMIIEDGEWLSWDGCEIYPKFSDCYTVEFRSNDDEPWVILGEYTESKSIWSHHMIDMNPYHGINGEIRFVCRSNNGYMLGLNNISIKKPTEYSFSSINHSPKFFAIDELEEDNAFINVSILNTGAPISSAVIGISVGEDIVSTLQEDHYWQTGETRDFRIPLPLTPNVRTDYIVTIAPSDNDPQIVGNSFAFCTSFKRYLYVDKGTGMWCNACPNGTLAIDELEDTYGDALIVCETHNGDLLANEMDFSRLGFYSIPHLMLNRVVSTKGENASQFYSQICNPTEMGIEINDLSIKGNGDLSVKATVSTSESFSDSDCLYRVGYIVTHNVNGNEDARYYQKNICTTAKQKQYRYLPSRMNYSLCYFPDVTIPSNLATTADNPAFTGISGSLPESLASGKTYECEWTIPLPDGFDSFNGMRVVSYILDANKKNIINSTASYVDDYACIEEVSDSSLDSATHQIFAIDGRKVRGEKNSLLPGLYIINGEKILVK
ncbi:MAG: hypothetical protein K2G77_01060 [Muribaculaceae bacterium]|nr:hypothetical protein [Muribaculaceae bacterium]